jgi:D-beta-D-heptose 7-phosphate kinase/D-beta-D-heptose 1-phosphate adenosyltransferase
MSAVPLGDTMLISDYGKGVCTAGMLQAIGERARAASVPILVDPARGRHWSDYGSVTLIKANRVEANDAAGGHCFHPLALVKRLSDEHRCHVVVTFGRHGMVASESSSSI